MKVIPRSQWTASIPKPVNSPFGPVGAEDVQGTPYFRNSEVTGISFLTPNESLLFVEISPFQYLDTVRKKDFSYRGFGDIAWNLAVAGNVPGVICLRGLCNKSAAHRDSANNSSNVAVLVMIGNEEPPTDLLLQNLASCRDLVQARFPKAVEGITTVPFDIPWDIEGPKESSQFKCSLPENYAQDSNVQTFELIENLAFWGYYRARNDGVYGPVCRNAVMELQADLSPNFYRKRVDGLYGRYTREAFCNYLRSF